MFSIHAVIYCDNIFEVFKEFDYSHGLTQYSKVNYLSFAELAFGHVDLVSVQLVHVGHDLGALDGQQNEAGGHFRRQSTEITTISITVNKYFLVV